MLGRNEWKTTHAKLVPQIISDGTGGLCMVIQAARVDGKDAARSYIWRGRIGGQIKKITIGRAELMSVADARSRAMAISQAIREGRDPHAEWKAAQVAQKAADEPQALMKVAEAFKLYMATKTAKTVSEMWRQYHRDVEQAIGHKAMVDVTTDDLARIVNTVGKRAATAGDRLQGLLSPFFRWASGSRGRLETGLSTNPMIGVEKPFGKVTKRKRYFSENEIRWFLMAVRELASEPRQHGKKDQATRRWCKGLEVLLRTGQRKMAILNAVDSELDYEAHTLTVPAERHKGGEEHKVWLVTQVEALLQSVERPDTDQRRSNSQRVFQRLGSVDTNLDRIRERMGMIAARDGGKVAHWTIHDLRRTFMTVAADLVDENDGPLLVVGGIKKTAGHVMAGVDAHYFHGQAMPHKRRTMKVWNEYLDRLMEPEGLQKAA